MEKEIEGLGIYKKLFEIKRVGIKLQRDTKAFNYRYADLGQIQEKLGEEMQKQNLIVIHLVSQGCLYTSITDIDGGGTVQSNIPLSEGLKAQDKGSEITYFRRYNLLCLLDLEVEDDDGKKASDGYKKQEDVTWLNFEDFEALIEAGNTTEDKLRAIIKEDGYKLSKKAQECVRKYVETGEIIRY